MFLLPMKSESEPEIRRVHPVAKWYIDIGLRVRGISINNDIH